MKKKNIFNIEVISKRPTRDWGVPSHVGRITINAFQETFEIPLDSWPLKEYKRQWKEGLERIGSHMTSCLVSSVYGLDSSPLIEIWTIYREETKAFFRQQILNRIIAQEINLPFPLFEFDRINCYECILPRLVNEQGKAIDEEGNKISEWNIDYKAIEEFAHSFKP
ncbi:MAG: hypothetical protein WA432_00725 [Candidatus Babeliaceae bacterium]